MSRDKRIFNHDFAKAHVIVENCLGRIRKHLNVARDMYNWKEEDYDIYFHICVVLTNFHVMLHPLRDVDGRGYQLWLKYIYHDAWPREENLNAQNSRYYPKSKLRMRNADENREQTPSSSRYDRSSEGYQRSDSIILFCSQFIRARVALVKSRENARSAPRHVLLKSGPAVRDISDPP